MPLQFDQFGLDIANRLSKRDKPAGKPTGKSKLQDYSGLKPVNRTNVSVDIEKAFQVVCKVESNCNYAIGDTGTAFGATQVQMGEFLNNLADDPNVEQLTGMSKVELKSLANSWKNSKKNIQGLDIWTTFAVDDNIVQSFISTYPNRVVKRREATILKYDPSNFTIIKIQNNRPIGYRLNLENLQKLGLDTNSNYIINELKKIINEYVTDGVAKNAISKLLTLQQNPDTFRKFQQIFSKRNVNSNQQLRNLADRASQADFSTRVNEVVNAVEESGYNTNDPSAYNIYQLIAISNASGVGRVKDFLKNKKPFSNIHLHYLQRANPIISKITGYSSGFPSGGGLEGFASTKIYLSKRADLDIVNLGKDIIKALELWLDNKVSLKDLNQYGIVYAGKNFENSNEKIIVVFGHNVPETLRTALPHEINNIPLELQFRSVKQKEESVEITPRERGDRPTQELPAITLIGPHIKEYHDLLAQKQKIKDESEKLERELGNQRFVGDKEVEEGIEEYLMWKYPEKAKELQEEVNKRREYTKKGNLFRTGKNINSILAHIIKKSSFSLKFPTQYVEDIRSGQREMTIRAEDLPVEIDQIVRCETYSGGYICDAIITSKETMSITRIKKAFGKKVASELEKKFGENARFCVIRFHRHDLKGFGEVFSNASFDTIIKNNLNESLVLKRIDHFASLLSLAVGQEDPNEWLKQHGLEDPDEEDENDEDEVGSPAWRAKEQERIRQLEEARKKQPIQVQIKQPRGQQPAVPTTIMPATPTIQPQSVEIKEPEEKGITLEEINKSLPSTQNTPEKPTYKTFEDWMKGAIIPKEDKKEEKKTDIDDMDEDIVSFLEREEKGETIDEMLESINPDGAPEEISQGVARTKLRNARTIYGFKLQPPPNGWMTPPVQPTDENVMEVFSVGNLKNFNTINDLFLKRSTWNVLNSQPNKKEILQNWVLPALIYNVGKKWFDVYANRGITGGAPFPLFTEEERDEAEKQKKPLDQTIQGQAYMKKITAYVTDAVNSYFSLANPQIPIATYVNSILRNFMKTDIGHLRGFKVKHRPICAVCKAEEVMKLTDVEKMLDPDSCVIVDYKKRSRLPYMSQTSGTKCWTCERCAEKAKNLKDKEIAQAESKVKTIQARKDNLNKNLEEARGDILRAQTAIEDGGRTIPNLERLEKALINYTKLEEEQKGINDIMEEVQAVLDFHNNQLKKYEAQQNVPYQHLWCPNEKCPGMRVPLTSVDWSKVDFWKSAEGQLALAYISTQYGIQPNGAFGIENFKQQKADDDINQKALKVLEEVLEKNPKYKDLLEKSPELKDALLYNIIKKNDLKAGINIYRVPPEKMWKIPFKCPHDGKEFTPQSAFGKGYEQRGGLLYSPWTKDFWYSKDVEEKVADKQIEDIEKKDDVDAEEKLAEKEFLDLIKQNHTIELNKKYQQIEEYKKNNPLLFANPEKLKTHIKYKEYIRNLALYETIRDFPNEDPEGYTSWMVGKGNQSLKSKKEQLVKTINRLEKLLKNKPTTYKDEDTKYRYEDLEFDLEEAKKDLINVEKDIQEGAKQSSTQSNADQVIVPVIKKWLDRMLGHTDEERLQGFQNYGINGWLVNNDSFGIPSYPTPDQLPKDKQSLVGSEGTFFIARAGEDADTHEYGFKMNLNSKKVSEYFRTKEQVIAGVPLEPADTYEVRKQDALKEQQKRRDNYIYASPHPKILKILGVWELDDDEIEKLGSKISGTTALNYNQAKELIKDKQNKVAEIESYDYSGGKFDPQLYSFTSNKPVLVQAYLAPAHRSSIAERSILNLRNPSVMDRKDFIDNFRELRITNEGNAKFWTRFRKEVKQAEGNIDKIDSIVKSYLNQDKKAKLSARHISKPNKYIEIFRRVAI